MLKSAMTSFSVRRFVNEARILVGSRFHKAYQMDYDTVVLRFAVPRANLESQPTMKDMLEGEDFPEEEGISLGIEKGKYIKIDMPFRLGQFVFLTARVRQEMPKEASGFAMTLRKALRNRVLERIEQLGMDRILHLEFGRFSGEEESYGLYLELFGDGNIILVRGDTIESPFTSRTWSTRVVKRGEMFHTPPLSIDPHELDTGRLKEMLSGEGDLVRTLIKKVSLPPVFSEEVCFRSGIEKDRRLGDLGPADIERVLDSVSGLIEELESGNGAYLYTSDDEPVLLEPMVLGSWFGTKDRDRIIREHMDGKVGGKKLVHYPTISKALEDNLFEKGRPPSKQESDLLNSRERVERMVDAQTKALKERMEEVDLYQSIADSLYLDYTRVDSVLKTFEPRAYASDPKTFPDVLDFELGPEGKGGWITIKLGTALGVRDIRLDITKDITHNAEEYYDMVKRSRSKIPGIERAIEEAKERMEDLMSTQVEDRPQVPLRRFWFEDFRWCFSSEGILMIGGRDARSNERLVKKYMRDGDRYAHADIKGAPSVIVRVEKDQVPGESTLEEACHLSVLNSKAWSSKLGAENAYWVEPNQVSRTPESGEFLPKGSFMVRGRKNMVLKLPMEGAIGLLYVEGVPKVMFGPPKAISVNCKGTSFLIVPGKRDKNEVSKMIARELGAELEQVLSVLPPGDMDISRRA